MAKEPYFILSATYNEDDGEVQNPDSDVSVGDVITFSDGTTAEFIPTVVPKIKHQSAGNMDVTTDNCGRTKARKNGDRNWDVVATSDYGLRYEMRQLMLMYEIDKTPTVQTDLYSGPIEIQDITVTQTASQNIGVLLSEPTQVAVTGDENKEVRIYKYQIQLKQPDSNEGGIQ